MLHVLHVAVDQIKLVLKLLLVLNLLLVPAYAAYAPIVVFKLKH